MPSYLDYHKSIADEFKALEKRLRYLIDFSHHGEDGRYKEIIVINYLRRILPQNLSVGTGFVRTSNKISNQIDIIIYDSTYPLLFKEGDFIVATPENILGIIEVKSNLKSAEVVEVINKCNINGRLIAEESNREIFNGIFSFNMENEFESYINNIRHMNFENYFIGLNHVNSFQNLNYNVNHIAFDSTCFVKYWCKNYSDPTSVERYDCYKLKHNLAISYFISNLLEFCLKGLDLKYLHNNLQDFLYPIPEGKEKHKSDTIKIGTN